MLLAVKAAVRTTCDDCEVSCSDEEDMDAVSESWAGCA